ncbi:FAD-binding oxidoreductase [Tessaracoccus oleiagri]|uniref:Glycolate oxidase FAD binding subunit n=1 Tax=Tessaracoccus oleiagri TaxID=686624 RepID=A0A1G9L618_9ACTN|nr:FAD-binding oxidoreductase [Tessaracoccus oleiagri]SDL57183.1 glycolate oxidase FAD binding subunit [Tessaracoccus oleiagri]
MSLLRAVLSAACEVREAEDADHVDGVRPQVVARPRTTDEVSALLRACHGRGLTVVARGNGTKLSWGRPPERCEVLLDTTGLDALVEHSRGDLVAIVGAGMPLARLQALLAEGGHQLVVDDPLGSTVGGAVATNLSGPRRMWTGAIRDLVIGVKYVRADGVVAKAGGRVVKNVAGYDLAKLLTGSYGTLAVITEVTLRLHPLPEASRWVTLDVGPEQLPGVLAAVVHSQLVPRALELHAPPDGALQVSALLEGSADGATARAEALAAQLDGARVSSAPPAWWGQLPEGDLLMKTTARLSGVPQLVAHATSLGLGVRGSAGTGVLYAAGRSGGAGLRRAAVVQSLRTLSIELGGSTVALDAPADVKPQLDSWGPVPAIDLMRRVKQEFDPARTLAPGRFVGGI